MKREPLDEAALLRAHAAGDQHSFERLYDRYDRACYRFVRRTLGTAHAAAADDLHQEAWISVSKSAATFDPTKASFAAWLFTIARRKVWDYFRRQQVAVVTSSRDDLMAMARDTDPTPLEYLESRQLAARLVVALEALPLAQRETFVLFADAGLSLDEIARTTGVAVETTKSRLRYARTTLRQTLAGERSAHV
jgi:RNA polymerase sigma-70 factor (ECF subfamily)